MARFDTTGLDDIISQMQRLKEDVNHTCQEAGAHAKGGGEEHNRQHAGRGN